MLTLVVGDVVFFCVCVVVVDADRLVVNCAYLYLNWSILRAHTDGPDFHIHQCTHRTIHGLRSYPLNA